MIKFVKGDSDYFPADKLIAIDAGTSAACVVTFPAKNGAAADAILTITTTAAKQGLVAEALIEEINFGKKAIIDVVAMHENALSAAVTGD
jgi:hypothetical protein